MPTIKKPVRTANKASKRDAAARARSAMALDLRIEGLSYAAIADRLGYANSSGAFLAVDRELNRWAEHSVEKLRKIQGRRYDELLLMLRAKALTAKSDDQYLWAVDRYLRALDGQARLYGLNMAADEKLAGMEYRKAIVLEEGDNPPLQLPEPSVDGDVIER